MKVIETFNYKGCERTSIEQESSIESLTMM